MRRKIAHNLMAHQKNKIHKHQNVGNNFKNFLHVYFDFPLSYRFQKEYQKTRKNNTFSKCSSGVSTKSLFT